MAISMLQFEENQQARASIYPSYLNADVMVQAYPDDDVIAIRPDWGVNDQIFAVGGSNWQAGHQIGTLVGDVCGQNQGYSVPWVDSTIVNIQPIGPLGLYGDMSAACGSGSLLTVQTGSLDVSNSVEAISAIKTVDILGRQHDQPNVICDSFPQECSSCFTVHIASCICTSWRSDSPFQLNQNVALDGLLSGGQPLRSDPWILTADPVVNFGTGSVLQDNSILASQNMGISAVEFSDYPILGNGVTSACVNCDSPHYGLTCPSSLAINPYGISQSNLPQISLTYDQEPVSLFELPSVMGSIPATPISEATYTEYLANRILGEISDFAANNFKIEGNLFITISVVLNSVTGPITFVALQKNEILG